MANLWKILHVPDLAGEMPPLASDWPLASPQLGLGLPEKS